MRQIYEWKVDWWNVNVLIIKLKWQQSGMDTILDEGICVPVGVSVSALKAVGCCDVISSPASCHAPGYNAEFKGKV